MKTTNVTLLALALLGGAMASAQQGDDLFAGTKVFEKNATDVTEINQGPETLGMVRGSRASTAHGMILNQVNTYEYSEPGQYNMADVDAIRQKLNTGDWHCSVHERNMKTGESTDICEKHRTDGLRETAIITVEKKELTFIHQIMKAGDGGHSDTYINGVHVPTPPTPPVPEGALLMPEMNGQISGEMAAVTAQLNSGELQAEMAKMQAQLSAGQAEMQRGVAEATMARLRAQMQTLPTPSVPPVPEVAPVAPVQ